MKTIPSSRVNDGYCDCEDGSDEWETYVCNQNTFVCKQEIGKDGNQRILASMFVNDGLCDCCDCSDEADSIRTQWTNKCDERNAATILNLQSIYDEQKEGRKQAIPLKETIKSIPKLLKSLKSESGSILSKYHANHRLSERQRNQFVYLQKRIEALETVSEFLRTKSKMHLQSLFGDRLQYLPLILECYHSQPFGEQEMKRGTPNYYNKMYSIEFCPFAYLVQKSNQTETWRRRNDFVSLGGSKADAAKIVLNDDTSFEQTLIGSKNAWLEDIDIPDHWKTQTYEGEDVCIDGSIRHTAVLYECGREGQIVEFRVCKCSIYDC
ncbi:glucosidase 2 subunit beta-like protein [Blastocystis sp. subtype 4]|uniref:glucosidase 2 subunit beta-like protein n=1 Tax=Blastocystis sp. subtype 4 TaxID=944170 RepID=UPI000711309A|nr:glucosidase 2 subunit beta-like protein [Blastocystis sp. subtype 4]KNB44115.1 glucosidase 2 subunit beta-like protein [Blastocystis sp. subtype 4]|eukprot:XP_014527553.1 glucosidase 2 subunit beta-like protein [Blastocystis sp. subtype 4]